MHAIEAALRKSDRSATDVRQTRATDASHNSPGHEAGVRERHAHAHFACGQTLTDFCKVCTIKLSHSRGSSLTSPAVSSFFSSFFSYWGLCFSFSGHTRAFARTRCLTGRMIVGRRRSLIYVHPTSLSPWSLHHLGVAHQSSLRSLWIMMCLCELPLLQGGG